MSEREQLRALLTRHEGNRLQLYYLNGIPHIGRGRNLQAKGISERESLLLLDDDLDEAVIGLADALPWFAALDVVRRHVLIDVAYNTGGHGALAFRKMLTAVAMQDWARAARELLDSDAARALPVRYRELAQMLTTGRAD